jgi:hypothetical protein
MSFSGKTVANTFKDILQIDNSNAGIATSLKVVKDGAGNQSALYIGDDNVKIKPENDDTTTLLDVQDKDGNTFFVADSSNDYVKALGHQVNTQYAYFGITNGFSSAYAANTHYSIPFNGQLLASESDVDFGTGTDPDDTFTTANTDTQYAAQIVPTLWRVPDNITIDSVTHIEGADSATGDTTRMHLKSFTFTSGATACLTAGALLAYNSDVTNAGNAQPYLSSWTVSSANVAANKVILCFFRCDSDNSDFSINVTVKYHLR